MVMPDTSQLRFIVLILDSKSNQHDGKVFTNLSDARNFGFECLQDHYGEKIVIGTFIEQGYRESFISNVEVHTLPRSQKKFDQLKLF